MELKESEIELYKRQVSFKAFSTLAYTALGVGLAGAIAFAGWVVTPFVLSYIPHTPSWGLLRFFTTLVGWGTIPAFILSNPKRIFKAMRARVFGWFKRIKKLPPTELALANLEQVRRQYESAKLFHTKAKDLGRRISQDFLTARKDLNLLESELQEIVPEYLRQKEKLATMNYDQKAEFLELESLVKRKNAEFKAMEKSVKALEVQKTEHDKRTLMVQSKYLEFENLVAQSEYVYKVICSQVKYADDMESFRQEFENLRANVGGSNITEAMDSEVLQQELEYRVTRADALFHEMMSPDNYEATGDSSMGYDLGTDLDRFVNPNDTVSS
ncbi:MAG: hypothetical protein IPN95_23960 [Bacteroidetes bacterium]|nr:hypothetical protein [Bacteroidota bacterium]MBL0017556.1 hypothetical protein [Bacteroidota bacterium]